MTTPRSTPRRAPRRAPTRTRRVLTVGAAAAVTLLVVLVVALRPGQPSATPTADTTRSTDTAGGDRAGSPPRGDDEQSAPLLDVQRAEAAAPARVRVPGLGISSSLDRLDLRDDGRLETPPRWQVAGWYAGGPRPGETGPAVIAGHVDSPRGPAVFTALERLSVGDTVLVDARDGSTRTFRVTRLTTAPRDGFPTEAVYGPTPDAELRLITCDGPYDAENGGYQDNLVVFATDVTDQDEER